MSDKNELSQEEYASMVFEEGGSLVVDMSNVAEQKFELIPKGIYNAEIDECSFGLSKSSGAPMFTLIHRITSGDFAGRKLYSYVSFSPKAISGAKTTLLRLDPQIFNGRFSPQEVADQGVLLGKPHRIKVSHEEYQGENRARVQNVMAAAVGGEGTSNGFFGG